MTAFTTLLLVAALGVWVGLFGFFIINAALPGGILRFRLRKMRRLDAPCRQASDRAAATGAAGALARLRRKASFLPVLARMAWWTAKNSIRRRAGKPGFIRVLLSAAGRLD